MTGFITLDSVLEGSLAATKMPMDSTLPRGCGLKFGRMAARERARNQLKFLFPRAVSLICTGMMAQRLPVGAIWGYIVAQYPIEPAAIAEGAYGKGSAIISGLHPESCTTVSEPARVDGRAIRSQPAGTEPIGAAV
jgi:hypothetical protein